MSDERTGRELAPRPDEGGGAITPREQPLPSTTPADRFSAGDQAHTVGLSEERAAQIVRSSSNARMAAFLAVLVVVLFIPIYWIYDIGLPFLGMGGRLEAQERVQYVQDVARGHELYLNNCARCHGDQGEGGIGPPLNDQGKLYNSITAQGLPGPGHFNPTYLHAVLRDGGRIVCGNPDSFMPAWEQPLGPLNYREVEEIIAFMLAPDTVEWTYFDEHVTDPDETPHPATREHGWRDPAYTPPPDATPVPACWSARPTTGPTPTAGPIESPGTPENPRVIEIHGTQDLRWVDAQGNQLTQIAVVAGETLEFHIINDSAVVRHNFHIGTQSELAAAPMDTDLPGTSTFTSADGPQIVPFNTDGLTAENAQFACTVPAHYAPMHGDFIVVDGGNGGNGGGGGGDGASPSPTGSPAP